MYTEFEATILDIDVKALRRKLKDVGAKLVYPERLMRRYIFAPFQKNKIHGTWVRVRDEGDKVTMSMKVVSGKKISDQKEVCLTIDSFEEGYDFLTKLGLKQKAYQETKREFWLLGKTEITIDTWPGLEPFVEVEGKDEKSVVAVVKKLGYDYSKAVFGAVDVKYQIKLGIPLDVINNKTPLISFKNPPKKYRKKQ
ncbi:MAG: hypothetical protein UT02_C0012G0027 [Parcubacteria group bacterium GW2011_GWC2_38_7]|nr:MAG: hypothetical protein UT02_C0012G0027 [Parcubacteria group bacterium GW2011_GWC2_38_7]